MVQRSQDSVIASTSVLVRQSGQPTGVDGLPARFLLLPPARAAWRADRVLGGHCRTVWPLQHPSPGVSSCPSAPAWAWELWMTFGKLPHGGRLHPPRNATAPRRFCSRKWQEGLQDRRVSRSPLRGKARVTQPSTPKARGEMERGAAFLLRGPKTEFPWGLLAKAFRTGSGPCPSGLSSDAGGHLLPYSPSPLEKPRRSFSWHEWTLCFMVLIRPNIIL